MSECDAITRTERSSTLTGATVFVLFLAEDATPLFIKILYAAGDVLVQREVESGRSPLASIAPFSSSQFGTTSPYSLAGGGTRAALLKLQLVSKGKHVGWSVLIQPGG